MPELTRETAGRLRTDGHALEQWKPQVGLLTSGWSVLASSVAPSAEAAAAAAAFRPYMYLSGTDPFPSASASAASSSALL